MKSKNNYKYYRTLLGYTERKIYDLFLSGFMKKENTLEITEGVFTKNLDYKKIINCVFLDNPQIFFINPTRFVVERKEKKLIFRFSVLYSRQQIEKIQSMIDEAKIKITAKCDGITDGEKKTKILHDCLAEKVEYCDLPNPPNDKHSLVGALTQKSAVCSGYSQAFKYLCDSEGIACLIVEGKDNTSENHAWNIVNFGNGWYHVDVTWDSTLKSHKYYLVNDDIISKDHFWNRELVPKC